MEFAFTNDQLRDRAAAAEFLASRAGTYGPACDSWITGFDREFSQSVAELGWIGITWPVEHGGAGRGYVDRLAVYELFLAAGAPVAAHWFADRQMAPSILAHGSPRQRQRYLPEIRRGEVTYAIGLSEPEAGSDLAAVRTKADRDGTGWRITGHKIWTSLAHHADYLYLLARTDPSQGRYGGLSEFIVPISSPGVTVVPIRDMSRANHFNEVFLDGVRIDADGLIGEEGAGWSQVTGQLAFERAGLERFMSCWPLLREMRALVGTDRQRLEQLGGLEAAAVAARQLVYRAAAAADQGRAPEQEAAVAKLFGTQLEQRIVEVASQWAGRSARLAPDCGAAALGGHLAAAWPISPSWTIRGGTSEVLTGMVARSLKKEKQPS